jgi:cytochrome P450
VIIAGFENTSSVIRTTMLYLMTTPAVYKRFKEEVMQAVREGRASSPITFEEGKRIPYLQVGLLL